LVENLTRRGIRLIPAPPKLIVEPAELLTDADCEAIRAAKPALMRLLTVDSQEAREEATALIERAFGRLDAIREQANLPMRGRIARLYQDSAPVVIGLWERGDYDSLRYALIDFERNVTDITRHRGWN
jgi:hypothetical protein